MTLGLDIDERNDWVRYVGSESTVMYVWQGKNRRDRRLHITNNPFASPSVCDLEDYKCWYDERRQRDERIRLQKEKEYVSGYAKRRVDVFKAFLETSSGKTEVRLVAMEFAKQEQDEKNAKRKRKSDNLDEPKVKEQRVDHEEKSSMSRQQTQAQQSVDSQGILGTGSKRSLKDMVLRLTKTIREKFPNPEHAAELNEEAARRIFTMFDGDGSGEMDKDELKGLLHQLCVPVNETELQRLMVELDTDKSDTIDFNEFWVWYQAEAQRQKASNRFKSAGMHVNKFLRAIKGLTLESEVHHLCVAYEEHVAKEYALRAFRASKPPTFACSMCGEALLTQQDLTEHEADEGYHETWRQKNATAEERFRSVKAILDGPMGRRFKAIRAQYDQLLHTPAVTESPVRMPTRPMKADPQEKRLQQFLSGACVETLSVYFSKRAAPSTELPDRFEKRVKAADLPYSLANVVQRMFHNDRSVFTAHVNDKTASVAGDRPPSNSDSISSGSKTKANSALESRLRRLAAMLPTDRAFPVVIQGRGQDCVMHEFRWRTGSQAFLLGSFTEWRDELMTFDSESREHTLKRPLCVGVHLYCFRVNGKLKVDLSMPVIGEGAHRRNALVVWSHMEHEGPTKNDLRIDLAFQNIRDHGVWFLFSAIELTRPVITHVDLSCNNISGQGIACLSPILDIMLHLRTLRLNDNGIGYAGAKALGEALERNVPLAALELTMNPLGDDGAEALAEGLRGNANLTSLNLDNTVLGDAGVRSLGDMLCHNAALRDLSIRYNRFGPTGAEALESALVRNASLQRLDLSYNKLEAEGAVALARALVGNDTLKTLLMTQCGVCRERAKPGIYYLAQSLQQNKSLTELSLRGNEVNNFGATHLARALTVNATLVALDISNNPLLEEFHMKDHIIYSETDMAGTPSIATSLEKNQKLRATEPKEHEEILCPQEKVEGEWLPNRQWLSRKEVEAAHREELLKAEAIRQAAEDEALKAAVAKAVEHIKHEITSSPGTGKLVALIAKGLKGCETVEVVRPRPKRRRKTTVARVVMPAKRRKQKSEKDNVEQKEREAEQRDKQERAAAEKAALRKQILRIFQAYDTNASMTIGESELMALVEDLRIPINADGIKKLIKELDNKGSGEIDFAEFFRWFESVAQARQKKHLWLSAGVKVQKFIKTASSVLSRGEAVRLIVAYEERLSEQKARIAFRKEHPPNHVCEICNKAFALDGPGLMGLALHKAEARAEHEELQRREEAIRPRIAIVESAMETLDASVQKEWPKLFVFTKHVLKDETTPVLDMPDDEKGRTIGGLDRDATIKAVADHGDWLQIEYNGATSAYIRQCRGRRTLLAVPLVARTKDFAAARTLRTALLNPNSVISRIATRVGLGQMVARLRAWPHPVIHVHYFTNAKYYRLDPDLPPGVNLKVRSQPSLTAPVVGLLLPGMLIRAVGESGDWVMVAYKTTNHAWMLVKNRMGRSMLRQEDRHGYLLQAERTDDSPITCQDPVEPPPVISTEELGRRDSDADDIIDLLASVANEKVQAKNNVAAAVREGNDGTPDEGQNRQKTVGSPRRKAAAARRERDDGTPPEGEKGDNRQRTVGSPKKKMTG